jgi:hypothetical protein
MSGELTFVLQVVRILDEKLDAIKTQIDDLRLQIETIGDHTERRKIASEPDETEEVRNPDEIESLLFAIIASNKRIFRHVNMINRIIKRTSRETE